MSGYSENTGYGQDQSFWQAGGQQQQGSYSFDVPGSQFGQQELNFQTFSDNSSGQQNSYPSAPMYGSNPYLDPSGAGSYEGEIFTPSSQAYGGETGGDFDEEPPLLEELGINPDHIIQKTLSVLNPFRTTESSILQDTDMAGPLVFCLAFGGILLLSGKISFSYIYGIGAMGCLAMYALLSLMAVSGVTLGSVVSVLGYCLLPMVVLAGVNVLLSLQGIVGIILTAVAIAWCSMSASKLLVTALSMDHQQALVAYPCALLYGVFALITIF